MTWETVEQNKDTVEIIEKKEPTSSDVVEDLISKISFELKVAHETKYDSAEAEKTAALCLRALTELSEFLAEADLISKEKKSDLESTSGERYMFYKFNYKLDGNSVKLSDEGVGHLVAQDPKVKKAKSELYQAESDSNKWKNLFGMLKDAHIFFRGLSKGRLDI
jgi:hypothetical protein